MLREHGRLSSLNIQWRRLSHIRDGRSVCAKASQVFARMLRAMPEPVASVQPDERPILVRVFVKMLKPESVALLCSLGSLSPRTIRPPLVGSR